MHVGEAAAVGVERQFATGAVLRSAMKAPASPRGAKRASLRIDLVVSISSRAEPMVRIHLPPAASPVRT
jgi:hypothetical protein